MYLVRLEIQNFRKIAFHARKKTLAIQFYWQAPQIRNLVSTIFEIYLT